MTEDRLTTLYNWSEEMTKAGELVGEKHEENYKALIDYVKASDTKERVLSAQLIARFFKYFPSHEEAAFDSIVDLCESVDVNVRKHATMAMISICRDCKHLVSKAADILIQLYQTNQATEVNLINQSLMTLLNLDIQKFLQSFFTNFEEGTEVVRERALKFLSTKIQAVAESALTKEVEEQIMSHSKKAMEDVTKDEFITFIGILTKLKIAKTVAGQAMIVLIIKSQAELDKDFTVSDTDTLDKFLLCTRSTIPLLSQYNRASEYMSYICLKILPHLNSLTANSQDLTVLQTLAEMSPFIHTNDIPDLIDLEKCQQAVYDKLLEYLPLPPQDGAKASKEGSESEPNSSENMNTDTTTEAKNDEPSIESSKSQVKSQEADFQFTHIEYLLFTFQQFCKLKPEFFNVDLQSDIRLRLLHLANGCSKYMEILSTQLRGVKSSEDLKKEENKLRSVALRTTKNITNIIVKDLFQKPPQFKTTILLSCKPLTSATVGNNISGNNNNSKPQANKANLNRQAGQKHKYRQSYQNDRNKRQRPLR